MNPNRTASTTPAISPLSVVDAAFLSLARGIRPLSLPAALLADPLVDRPVPVDQVRARIVHPSCRPEVRERIWSDVASRARREGEPWTTVVCGLAVPGLRRMLARLGKGAHIDRSEIEQEALAGLVAELADVELGDPLLARRLLRAADRAAHQMIRADRPRRVREVTTDLPPITPALPSAGSCGDEYTVLWQAVRDQIVTPDDADLIARTRLDLASVDAIAMERGVSRRTIFRQRAAAEKSLGEALRHRASIPPQR
ncbi:hypothetical protein ABZ746_17445 [Streptomyces sp. NPDC020096]